MGKNKILFWYSMILGVGLGGFVYGFVEDFGDLVEIKRVLYGLYGSFDCIYFFGFFCFYWLGFDR